MDGIPTIRQKTIYHFHAHTPSHVLGVGGSINASGPFLNGLATCIASSTILG